MLGAIIGDIYGSTYEFNNSKIFEEIVRFREGSYPTDDSVMTVAVAKALMNTKGLPEEIIKDELIDSMHFYGHLFPDAGYGQTFYRWIAGYYRNAYNSWGNGSGMRVSSVGWLFDSLPEVLYYAQLTAEVTHNHPEGIKGAQAIAACIYLARTGHDKEKIRRYVEDNFYSLDFTLDKIRPTYEFDVSCQGSCPQAIEAFLEGDDFEDVIRKAISIGGDSDTIACMAGAIAEAYYGIPEDLKEEVFAFLVDKEDGYNVYHDSYLADGIKKFYQFIEKKEG